MSVLLAYPSHRGVVRFEYVVAHTWAMLDEAGAEIYDADADRFVLPSQFSIATERSYPGADDMSTSVAEHVAALEHVQRQRFTPARRSAASYDGRMGA